MQPSIKPWDNRPQFENLPPKSQLPTMYDLPSESPGDAGLPDDFHILQPRLLSDTFKPATDLVTDYFTATDMNLYYDPANPMHYKRPDWFAVLGSKRADQINELRLSYVIWQEEIAPYLLIELLSPGTEKEDLGTRLRDIEQPPGKWDVYERYLQIPYYAVYSRYTGELKLFSLIAGSYQLFVATATPNVKRKKLWLSRAGIGLGIWNGSYQGVFGHWLRFFDVNGQWIPSPEEQLIQKTEQLTQKDKQLTQKDKQLTQKEKQLAQEKSRAERYAVRLRELGIDPEAY
jgi:Uma2 family endonuclease